jgi:hypothetical protein
MIEDYEGVLTTSRKAGSQEAPEDQGTSVKWFHDEKNILIINFK